MTPTFQLGPLWLYERAVVRRIGTDEEFVIRRCHVGLPSTAELVTNSDPRKPCGRMTYDEISRDYEPVGKRVSIIRNID